MNICWRYTHTSSARIWRNLFLQRSRVGGGICCILCTFICWMPFIDFSAKKGNIVSSLMINDSEILLTYFWLICNLIAGLWTAGVWFRLSASVILILLFAIIGDWPIEEPIWDIKRDVFGVTLAFVRAAFSRGVSTSTDSLQLQGKMLLSVAKN